MALVREADVECSMDSSGHFGLAADSAIMRLLLLQTAAATLLTSPLPRHLSLASGLAPLDSIQPIAVNRDNVKMASVSTSARPEMGQWRKNLSAHLICPECREVPPNLEFPDSHETVCGSCGLVLADREIDMHSEWRTFSNDDQNNDDPSRVGDATNPLLNGDQLETQIASGGSGRARE
ncbi:hypothetical protein KXX11_007326, partial [Aspergillus fumigatus]